MRGRNMFTDLDLPVPPFTGHQPDHLAGVPDGQHLVGRPIVEIPVQRPQQRRIAGIPEGAVDGLAINLCLQAHMGRMLLLQGTALWIGIEIAGQ